MKRGDTAMWALTKMAMLFFIASLAGILLVFGGYEKTGLCNEEARQISNRIASGITQLLNTPVEDERRVIQLAPSLALGESSRARYFMEITRRSLSPDKPFNALVISVTSEADSRCSAGVQVTYSKALDNDASVPGGKRFFLLPAPAPVPSSRSVPSPEKLVLRPSVLKADYGDRTTFVALLKCTEKKTRLKTFYWLQDCTQRDSSACINLETAGGAAHGISAANAPDVICGFR